MTLGKKKTQSNMKPYTPFEILVAQSTVINEGLKKAILARPEEPEVVQVMCDSCQEMEDEDSAHSYGDATFCDSCYEGCIA